VRKHISFCGDCADEVLRITRIEDDLEEDSVKWVSEDPEPEPAEEDKKVAAISKIAANLIIWTSKLWEPKWAGQLVTASDIPEQENTFVLDDGKLRLSCSWEPSYENIPAYIKLSWIAQITISCELWARFANPETHKMLSEIPLGNSLEGKKIFTSDKLRFDPSTEKWSVSIVMCKICR